MEEALTQTQALGEPADRLCFGTRRRLTGALSAPYASGRGAPEVTVWRRLAWAIVQAVALAVAAPLRAGGADASAPIAPLLNPPTIDGGRIPVSVAFRIINISGIDEVAQHFDVVGYLVAEWKDPRLAFTPRAAWEQFRTYRADEIWVPRFDFVNGVTPHTAHDVTVRGFPDGTVRYSERSSATLSTVFDLRPFPFDRQSLDIFIHPSVSEDYLVEFVGSAGDASISAEERVYRSLAQWTIEGLQAHVESIEGIGKQPISEIHFVIQIGRQFGFYIWKVFIPLLLMVVLSWTVLWIDPSEMSAQATVSVTTILTVIAFAFAISANLPKVPYLTFLDVFFLTCYLFVFITAVEITTVHVVGRRQEDQRVEQVRRLSRRLLPLAFLAVCLVLVLVYYVR